MQIFLACQICNALFGFAFIYSIRIFSDLFWVVASNVCASEKYDVMKFSVFICAFKNHPIASNAENFSFVFKQFAVSWAMMFGDFFIVLESWKQGNAKSPGMFSGGISIYQLISSCKSGSSFESISANCFLYDSIIVKFKFKICVVAWWDVMNRICTTETHAMRLYDDFLFSLIEFVYLRSFLLSYNLGCWLQIFFLVQVSLALIIV